MSKDSIEKHFKDVIDEIAKEEGFIDYKIISKLQDFTGDNYSGDVTRLEIRPSDGKDSLHLLMKTAANTPQLRAVVPLEFYYKNETFSYTNIIPAVRKTLETNGVPPSDIIRFAKFYKSVSETLKEAIIMKDMCHEGYVLHDKRKSFNQEETNMVIRTVAMLHAASFAMKEKDPDLYRELSKSIPHTNNYNDDLSHLSQSFMGYLSHIECPKSRAKVNDFGATAVERLIEVLDSTKTEPYNVICHGDCWNNNMLFKYEEEKVADVLLIDWQIVRIASPATDLCYMMFMSMDAGYVDEHTEDLLDLYYSSLQEYLSIMGLDVNLCYPKEIFHQHIKRSMIFGFIMAICGIPMILVEPKDAQKIEELIVDAKSGINVSLPMNDAAKKRYNNAVNYFVKRGYI